MFSHVGGLCGLCAVRWRKRRLIILSHETGPCNAGSWEMSSGGQKLPVGMKAELCGGLKA